MPSKSSDMQLGIKKDSILKNKFISLAVGILCILIVYSIIQANLSGIVKFIYSVLILYTISLYYKHVYKLESIYGFLLLRSNKGLFFIQKFALKYANYINVVSDVYYAMLFGLSFLYFAKWLDIGKRIICLLTAFIILFLLSITAFIGIAYFVNFSDFKPTLSQQSAQTDLLPFVFVIGGIFFGMIIMLIDGGYKTLMLIIQKISGQHVIVKEGVALILPGINIPLFEGILALVVILIVHEFAHAIVAVVHRIKLKNTGFVFFGSLPVGAFVELDEKKLFASPNKAQVRVLSAGIGANILTAIIFTIFFLIFLILTTSYTMMGCYAKDSAPYIVLIDKANPCIKAGPLSIIRVYPDQILNSIYNFFGLVIALNVFVGLMNALPLPFFDGGYIIKATINNDLINNAIIALVLIGFIILIVPAFI